MAVADLEREVLGHLLAVEHGPDGQPDLGGAAQADLRCTWAWMRASSRSVATSSASRLRVRSSARSRLRHTISRSPGNSRGALISARSRSSNSDSCSGPSSAASAWIAGARRQVIQSEPRRREIVADARRGDHAAIADHHQPADREAVLHLLDLRAQRRSDRPCCRRTPRSQPAGPRAAQQAVDDLRPILAVVAAVAVARQRAAPPLEVGGADVVEHEHAILEMTPRQAVLDPRLALQQPVERLVGLALLAPCPGPAPRPGWSPPSPHRPPARTPASSAARSAGRPASPPPGRNGAARPRPWSCSRSAGRARACGSSPAPPPHGRGAATRSISSSPGPVPITVPPLSSALQPIDHVARQLAQIGSVRFCARPVLVAIALPQQDRRRRIAIGHALDEHAAIESQIAVIWESLTWTQNKIILTLTRCSELYSRRIGDANFRLNSAAAAESAAAGGRQRRRRRRLRWRRRRRWLPCRVRCGSGWLRRRRRRRRHGRRRRRVRRRGRRRQAAAQVGSGGFGGGDGGLGALRASAPIRAAAAAAARASAARCSCATAVN